MERKQKCQNENENVKPINMVNVACFSLCVLLINLKKTFEDYVTLLIDFNLALEPQIT